MAVKLWSHLCVAFSIFLVMIVPIFSSSSALLNVVVLFRTGFCTCIPAETMKKEETVLLTGKPECKCTVDRAGVIWMWIVVKMKSYKT